MIDRQTEETASLYVLDLLNDVERRSFEARMRRDPQILRLVEELGGAAASLAHTVPIQQPPARVLDQIHARIGREPASWIHYITRINRIPAAFPLAACILLSVAVFLLVADRAGRADFESELRKADASYESFVDVLDDLRLLENERDLARSAADTKDQALKKLYTDYQELRLQNENALAIIEHLRNELTHTYGQVLAYRFPREGSTNLIVIELVNPESHNEDSGFAEKAIELLSESATRIMAYRRSDEIPSNTPNANPDPDPSQVIADNFFLALDPTPSADAPLRTAKSAGTRESNPVESEAAPEDIVTDAKTPVIRSGEPSPFAEPLSAEDWMDIDPEIEAVPEAIVFWDQKKQVGIVQTQGDFPKPSPGMTYQMWMEDPSTEDLINIGVFSEVGREGIVFTSPGDGQTPVNIIITEEPEGGSITPQGRRVLVGRAQQAAQTPPKQANP